MLLDYVQLVLSNVSGRPAVSLDTCVALRHSKRPARYGFNGNDDLFGTHMERVCGIENRQRQSSGAVYHKRPIAAAPSLTHNAPSFVVRRAIKRIAETLGGTASRSNVIDCKRTLAWRLHCVALRRIALRC